jgi:FkbM family methyltransferase
MAKGPAVLQTRSDSVGVTSFSVSPDLFGSSLLHPEDFRSYKTVEIKVSTLDTLAKELLIKGRGVLKIDVQYAEHLALKGATELLEQVDVLVIEMALVRYDPGVWHAEPR